MVGPELEASYRQPVGGACVRSHHSNQSAEHVHKDSEVVKLIYLEDKYYGQNIHSRVTKVKRPVTHVTEGLKRIGE